MEVKELTFWFRLLPLIGILGVLMGGEGQHPWRTWCGEAVRQTSGTAAISPSVGLAQLAVEKGTCFPPALGTLLSRFVSFGWN